MIAQTDSKQRCGQDRGNIRRYLYGTLDELPSPWLMKDMDKAVEILRNENQENKKIRIIGDYDIDGVTSTYILLQRIEALQELRQIPIFRTVWQMVMVFMSI
ncbi:MAG: hypothetical protein ACLUD0_18280 [Eubacterium ramulus]